MPLQQVWVSKGVPSTSYVPIDVMERASPDVFTVTTADPGAAAQLAVGTLALASRTVLPQSANFKMRVENETMLVTGVPGTGAGTVPVIRGYDNTTATAHTTGVTASLVVGVPRGEPVDAGRQVSYKGRSATPRTPGRAVITGQKIFAIHNAVGSAVIVDVHNIMVDMVQTVSKLLTVLPPIMRVYKFTAVPTNGTALTKNGEDSSLVSKTAVTCWGDASSDGTSSATTLTIAAITNGSQTNLLTQMFAPRITHHAAPTASSINPFVELMDRATFFDSDDEIISLRAGEGLAIHLDFGATTQNPITDMWTAAIRWVEYSPA